MFPLLMFVMLFWANHICGNVKFFMSLDPVLSILLWGGLALQDTRGSSDYRSTKKVSKDNLSYCKIHPLHNMFKGCIEGHYNHCSLNTFYPAKEDYQRERRYCFFTYNGAYIIPCQSHRKQVGGTYSI